MLKQLLRKRGIKLSDKEFDEILQITTDDIRENRVKFGKRTNLKQVLNIAIISSKVLMIV